MSQPAFGRRVSLPAEEPADRQAFGRAKSLKAPKPGDGAGLRAEAPPPSAEVASAGAEFSIEEELAQWKEARRFPIPWRQLSLMATLCFGAASLVLPDNVEAPVEWLLYFLTLASMVTTVAAWWKKLTHVA